MNTLTDELRYQIGYWQKEAQLARLAQTCREEVSAITIAEERTRERMARRFVKVLDDLDRIRDIQESDSER